MMIGTLQITEELFTDSKKCQGATLVVPQMLQNDLGFSRCGGFLTIRPQCSFFRDLYRRAAKAPK